MTEALRIEVTRGDVVESVHEVAACAVDARGAVVFEAGNVHVPVFLRSSAKPFIAGAVVEGGAAQRFGLDAREIAVMTGSHAGEPFHVEAVLSILRKIGMEPSALRCGAHWPFDESAAAAMRSEGREPNVLHNNCSGKHAGILALCRAIGADPTTYLEASNPAQQRILNFCARLSDDDPATWPVGVDGCGIPVYATSLQNAATAFVRLATLDGIDDHDAAALAFVRRAMLEHPQYVAGTGQFDTELMRVTSPRIAAKAGAEGVHGVAAVAARFGYVSKVSDGSSRGRGPSTIAALHALGALDERDAEKLTRFRTPAVYNRAGRAVGAVRMSPLPQ